MSRLAIFSQKLQSINWHGRIKQIYSHYLENLLINIMYIVKKELEKMFHARSAEIVSAERKFY